MTTATQASSASQVKPGKVFLSADWVPPAALPNGKRISHFVIEMNTAKSNSVYRANVPQPKVVKALEPLRFVNQATRNESRLLYLPPEKMKALKITAYEDVSGIAIKRIDKDMVEIELSRPGLPVLFELPKEDLEAERTYALHLTCDNTLNVTGKFIKDARATPAVNGAPQAPQENKEDTPAPKKKTDVDKFLHHLSVALVPLIVLREQMFRKELYSMGTEGVQATFMLRDPEDDRRGPGNDPILKAAKAVAPDKLKAVLEQVHKLEAGENSLENLPAINKLCIRTIGKEALKEIMSENLKGMFINRDLIPPSVLAAIESASDKFTNIYS